MDANLQCNAALTPWIEINDDTDELLLVEDVIKDINSSINELLNRGNEKNIFIESAQVFLKNEITDKNKRIRFYVTMCGRNRK
jgi:hypothetical protein